MSATLFKLLRENKDVITRSIKDAEPVVVVPFPIAVKQRVVFTKGRVALRNDDGSFLSWPIRNSTFKLTNINHNHLIREWPVEMWQWLLAASLSYWVGINGRWIADNVAECRRVLATFGIDIPIRCSCEHCQGRTINFVVITINEAGEIEISSYDCDSTEILLKITEK